MAPMTQLEQTGMRKTVTPLRAILADEVQNWLKRRDASGKSSSPGLTASAVPPPEWFSLHSPFSL